MMGWLLLAGGVVAAGVGTYFWREISNDINDLFDEIFDDFSTL
jgi:hypothetical protein